MSNAVFAHGSVLKVGGTTVSESITISGPNISVDMLDVTSHGSSNAYREFIKGLRDAGEITVEGNLIYATYNTLLTNVNTSSAASVTITIPTTPSVTQWEADAHVSELTADMPVDGKADFSATLKITSKPTLSQI